MMKEIQNCARVSLAEKLSTFGIVAFYYSVFFFSGTTKKCCFSVLACLAHKTL